MDQHEFWFLERLSARGSSLRSSLTAAFGHRRGEAGARSTRGTDVVETLIRKGLVAYLVRWEDSRPVPELEITNAGKFQLDAERGRRASKSVGDPSDSASQVA